MRPPLQREFLSRKLLESYKDGKQQYTSGASQRGTAPSNQLPLASNPDLPGTQRGHPRMKMPLCLRMLVLRLPKFPAVRKPHRRVGRDGSAPSSFLPAVKSTPTALIPGLPSSGLYCMLLCLKLTARSKTLLFRAGLGYESDGEGGT